MFVVMEMFSRRIRWQVSLVFQSASEFKRAGSPFSPRSPFVERSNPAVTEVEALDHQSLLRIRREATSKAIRKAMWPQPSIDWLLENQETVEHTFHRLGLAGQL